MKRVLSLLVPAVLSGCVTLPLTWQQPPAHPPAPAKPTAAAPVTPEEVTADNVRAKVVALEAELEREARQSAEDTPAPAGAVRPQPGKR